MTDQEKKTATKPAACDCARDCRELRRAVEFLATAAGISPDELRARMTR